MKVFPGRTPAALDHGPCFNPAECDEDTHLKALGGKRALLGLCRGVKTASTS